MKIFHTADIHFGVENYGRIDPTTGIHTRLLDFNKALGRCVDDAIEQDIDAFILAGDAYKTAHPTPTQQKLLMAQLLKLQAARIPVIIVVGNHDHPLSFGKAHALDVFSYLPVEGFFVFAKPDMKVISTKRGPLQVVGIPWPIRNNVVVHDEHRHKTSQEITNYLSARVSELIAHFAAQVDSSVPAVMVGHLTVSNGIFSGSEKCAIYGTDPLFLPSQLAHPQFNYVALGHLHRYQNLNPSGSPAVVYSGSIERVDFGERKEKKGYCRIMIDRQHESFVATHQFVELPSRSMLQVDVTIDVGCSPTEQILKALASYDIAGSILKIVYHLGEGVSDKVDLAVIQRAALPALHLVGIIPVYQLKARERRLDAAIEMTIPALVQQYLHGREHLKKRENILYQKALELCEQIDMEGEAGI